MYIILYIQRNGCLRSDNSINNFVEMLKNSIIFSPSVVGKIVCVIRSWDYRIGFLLLIQGDYAERCSLWVDHSYLFILLLSGRRSKALWEVEKAM